MRALLLLLLAPSLALAQGPAVTRDLGSVQTGPRILGEPAFVFELDALSQDETSRPGWPVTTIRASGATCIDGHSVGVNEACVSSVGLEAFAAGVGGRTVSDQHTVSTAGWDPASGSFCAQITLPQAPTGTQRIVWVREGAMGLSGFSIYYSTTAINLQIGDGEAINPYSSTGSLDATGTHTVCLRWSSELVVLTFDGQVRISVADPPVMPSFPAIAYLGSHSTPGTQPLNGSIRLLRVSE